MKKSFFLSLQIRGHTGLLIYFPKETKSRCIGLINTCSLLESPSGFVPFLSLDLDQSQQMLSLDELGILCQNFTKLDGSHIFMPLSAKKQGMVVFFDGFINGIQFVGICLQFADIF